MKSILENRPALAKEVNKVAEVAGYLWQKGWAERMPAHAKKFVGIAGTTLAISNPKGITIKVYAGFFLI